MAHADGLDLVVTTPGVATTRLRAEVDSLPESDLVVDQATRCGSTAVDLTAADRLRLAVVPCGVSLHAADQLRRELRSTRQSVDSVIICREPPGNTVVSAIQTVTARFECPVTVNPAVDTVGSSPRT